MEQYGLIFCRALGLVSFLPLDSVTPGYGIKVILTLFLSCGAMGFADPRSLAGPLDYLNEFMAGFAQALPIIIILQAMEIVADAIEALRGQTIGSVLDPQLQNENSILPILMRGLFWVILIQSGILEAVFVNFVQTINSASLEIEFWKKNLAAILPMLTSGFGAALLFATTILTIETGMMFTAKLVPNIEIENFGFAVRSCFCFLALIAVLKTDFINDFVLLYQRTLYG